MSLFGAIATAALGEAVSAGSDYVSSLLSLTPRGNLGGIQIQAVIEEHLTDTVQITEHPVEQGAQISDHAFVRNPEIVIRCGWSNSGQLSLSGVADAIESFVSDGTFPTIGDYVGSVYQQLLQLQQNLTVFDVTSSIRTYSNMMMPSLSVTRDEKTSQALLVTAVCRQIRVVSTSSTTLPPIQNQANPASTAEVVDAGVQAPVSATPSSGGSFPVPTDGFS